MRTWTRRLLVAISIGIIAWTVGQPALGAPPPDGPPAWQQVGLPQHPVVGIDTPGSGAMFVRLERELWRSDDAGLTWRPVPLAEDISLIPKIVVDPHDHTTLYLQKVVTVERELRDPLLRSRDEGASWQQILPRSWTEDDAQFFITTPAQSGLLYSAQKSGLLLRSEDGGDSWTDLSLPAIPHPQTRMGCVDYSALYPHPSNPDLLYRVSTCRVNNALDAAAELPYRTEVSHDRGGSWTTLASSPFQSVYATLRGCGAAAPNRLFLADRQPDIAGRPSGQPAVLLRSDDSGQTWQQVRGGEEGQDERILQVACNLTHPDQVYVLRTDGETAGIRVSQDGGQTWQTLTGPDGVKIHGIAVGIDGRYLFLATSAGVWRLPLTDAD